MPDVVEVFPENWSAVDLFITLGTQWRVGAGGATGLDYCALWKMVERLGLSKDEEDDLFLDVRYLEYEALKLMRRD